MGNMKYVAAYLNALIEEGTRQDLIDWLIKLHRENVDLKEELNIARLQRDAKRWT